MELDNELAKIKDQILKLRRGSQAGRSKPHKLVMLLAVLDLAEDNLLTGNRIYFDENLINRFEHHFHRYKADEDWCQPGPPFFHLRTSGFWHHKVIPGRQTEYRALSTTGGGKGLILQNIEYAYLSDEAYRVICLPELRRNLRCFLEELLEQNGRSA